VLTHTSIRRWFHPTESRNGNERCGIRDRKVRLIYSRRATQVIELRYFGGMGAEETGEVLGVSTQIVRRD